MLSRVVCRFFFFFLVFQLVLINVMFRWGLISISKRYCKRHPIKNGRNRWSRKKMSVHLHLTVYWMICQISIKFQSRICKNRLGMHRAFCAYHAPLCQYWKCLSIAILTECVKGGEVQRSRRQHPVESFPGWTCRWCFFPEQTKSWGQHNVPASIMRRQDQKWRMFLHFS